MLSEYWENEGQNWAKSKLDFLIYELLHEQMCGFFSLKFKTVDAFLLFSNIF